MSSVKNFDNRALWKGAVAGLVAGLVGSWVKSKVEPPLQKFGEKILPQKDLRGTNVPPATFAGEISENLPRRIPDTKTTEESMTDINYLFGTTLGIGYGIVAEEILDVTVGAGVPIGAAMWAGTHVSTLPALELQDASEEMPASWHVWEFGSHLVYGLTVELVRRAVRSRL